VAVCRPRGAGPRTRRRERSRQGRRAVDEGLPAIHLRWRFKVTESEPPAGFRLDVEGDFVGRGIWTLRPEIAAGEPGGRLTSVVYDWSIVAEKGILKRLSPIMKPIFGANHRWAMAQGSEASAWSWLAAMLPQTRRSKLPSRRRQGRRSRTTCPGAEPSWATPRDRMDGPRLVRSTKASLTHPARAGRPAPPARSIDHRTRCRTRRRRARTSSC
jgi:hypothetical protein